MSEDPDWANLNPDDSQNSNFYYNQSQQQFSLSPVYKKEDLPMILNSIKSRCNFINFDYLKNIEQFKDVLNDNETGPKELSHYAEESVFLNLLDKDLQKSVHHQENSSISSKKVNVKRKNPLTANFFDKIQKQGFENSYSEEFSDQEEELTFKDLKNFNLQNANKYRLNQETPIKSMDLDNIIDEVSLLQYFFENYHEEQIVFDCSEKDLNQCNCKIYIENQLLVEFSGKSERYCKKNVSQLLLTYFCPGLLKQFQNKINQNPRKKIKTRDFDLKSEYSNANKVDNFMNLHDFNNVLKMNSNPNALIRFNTDEKILPLVIFFQK